MVSRASARSARTSEADDTTKKRCLLCDKVLPLRKRKYCSTRCQNRAKQVALYGLSTQQYRTLLDASNGKCPICQRRVRRWNVDHDHATGLVRGIVCGTCNQRVLTIVTGLDRAEALVAYYSKTPAEQAGITAKVGPKIEARKGRYYR